MYKIILKFAQKTKKNLDKCAIFDILVCFFFISFVLFPKITIFAVF